ncbi:DMT family transporter [Sphingomonas oligophenolica]|uniref:DMT family transporter n=1 Tax=Sphingomonas oligophenolica TaxID=301154 RepID=A0ABU9Y0G6_9SPHN
MPRIFILGDIRRGGLLAIAAALLFGLSTPAAKLIVGSVDPLLLAGLLYLGSGLGLTLFRLFRRRDGLHLARADYPWLACMVLFGGAIGPALLMQGLTATTGSAASLLLTLEGVFTALIAWIVFREPFNRRIGLGMAAIFLGAVLLGLRGSPGHAGLLGALAITGACLAWAIDNNCTAKIADVDALTLAAIKGVCAGIFNIAIALAVGSRLPALPEIGAAATVGFLGYGLSLVLFVLALREIGAARTGAYFSTAPFIGALIGLVALREPLTVTLAVAGLLMTIGVWLHLTEAPAAPEPTSPP